MIGHPMTIVTIDPTRQAGGRCLLGGRDILRRRRVVLAALASSMALIGCTITKPAPNVQKVIEIEASAFVIVGSDAQATYAMPEIDDRVMATGTVTAYIDRGTDGKKWVAMPFAYQAPDKTAAIITYHYQPGSFTVAVVSPVATMRDAIVTRVDGQLVRVVIES